MALDVSTSLHEVRDRRRLTPREIIARPRILVLVTALVSECVIVLIATRPDLRFAYDLPELRIVLETLAASSALLAAAFASTRICSLRSTRATT